MGSVLAAVYLQDAERLVFTRRVYAPAWADDARLVVIPPSIDPFSAKNVPLSRPTRLRRSSPPWDCWRTATRTGRSASPGETAHRAW